MGELLITLWPLWLIIFLLVVAISLPDPKPTKNVVDKFLEHKFKTPNTKK